MQLGLGHEKFITTLRFRVSGQGERFFGDGLGLWFSHSKSGPQSGQVMGHPEKFTGFGILLDTFRNFQSGHVHRDVSLLVSNGSTPASELLDGKYRVADRPGCPSDFRYHEGRADFDVSRSSLLRVVFADNTVRVLMDAKASGSWRECFAATALDLPDKWWETARLGVTASTGALADNHDVISLTTTTYSPEAVMLTTVGDHHAELASAARGSETELQQLTGGSDQFVTAKQMGAILRKERRRVEGRMRHMHHHMEHQITALVDGMKIEIGKIDNTEKAERSRIAVIDQKLRDYIKAQVESVDLQMGKVQAGVAMQMNNLNGELLGKVAARRGGWVYPMLFLVLVIVAAVAALAVKYRQFMKRLLP